jgi:hypothetical protein
VKGVSLMSPKSFFFAVVYNEGVGEFKVSQIAKNLMNEMVIIEGKLKRYKEEDSFEEDRTNPHLVRIVLELGKEAHANSDENELKLCFVPVDYSNLDQQNHWKIRKEFNTEKIIATHVWYLN